MKTIKRLLTGFDSLDNLIGGFQFGSLITFAGRPCMRTEHFTYSLMRYWLNNKDIEEDIVFFSLRTREEFVTNRMALHTLGENQRSTRWRAEYHMKGLDLSLLCDKIRSYAWKENKRVFVIDNFNMIENSVYQDLRQNNQIIAKELCKLSHELGVIIIVDAMLFSYYIEEREGIEGKHPCLADLGYQGMSGDLDVFSDVVLGFWAPEKYHIYRHGTGEDLREIVEIEVLKNVEDDNSEGRRISLLMNKKTQLIENPTEHNNQDSVQTKATEPF